MNPWCAVLTFIFITVALDMLAPGLIVPTLPKLVQSIVPRPHPGRRRMSEDG